MAYSVDANVLKTNVLKTNVFKTRVLKEDVFKTACSRVLLCFALLAALPLLANAQQAGSTSDQQGLSLITANADEGFALAVTLARRGVTTTQTDREVLMRERKVYSEEADALIAASQVVAIHFQTIAAANNYWNE